MATTKKDARPSLTPTEKVRRKLQRLINRLDRLQADYDRGRAAGTIKEPIAFCER